MMNTIGTDLLSEKDAKDGETYILVRHGMKLDVSMWSYDCCSFMLPHLGPDLVMLGPSSWDCMSIVFLLSRLTSLPLLAF